MWTCNKERTFATSCLPKVGSTSFRNAIRNGDIYTSEQIIDVPVRVLWIREWSERVVSAYSMYHWLKVEGRNNANSKEIPDDYESFVDFILTNDDHPEARHWLPQSDQVKLDGDHIYTHVYKFTPESVRENWSKHNPGRLPWANSFTHLPTNDYRYNDLKEYYQEDDALWHSL